MDFAELAERSALGKGTLSQTFGCILSEFLAGGTQGGSAPLMLFAPAVQAYHQRDDFLFLRQALVCGRPIIRRSYLACFARFIHKYDYTRTTLHSDCDIPVTEVVGQKIAALRAKNFPIICSYSQHFATMEDQKDTEEKRNGYAISPKGWL
jgi:hypothetical protein